MKPGAKRASYKEHTQAAADERAAEILRNAGDGERVTKGVDGQIRTKDTIGPASDPSPPRDNELAMDACDVWLLDQATVRRPPLQAKSPVTYDEKRQASVVVLDGGEPLLAVEALGGSPTKKGDIEKGEDQKDRWRP